LAGKIRNLRYTPSKIAGKTHKILHGEDDMKLDEIKEIAKQHNIKVGKMKKADLVRAIQQAENNEVCFETGKAESCGQDACLWQEDCR
jgi:hypothetical protein